MPLGRDACSISPAVARPAGQDPAAPRTRSAPHGVWVAPLQRRVRQLRPRPSSTRHVVHSENTLGPGPRATRPAPLEHARAAAARDTSFEVNVDALERVLPPDVGADEIQPRLGARRGSAPRTTRGSWRRSSTTLRCRSSTQAAACGPSARAETRCDPRRATPHPHPSRAPRRPIAPLNPRSDHTIAAPVRGPRGRRERARGTGSGEGESPAEPAPKRPLGDPNAGFAEGPGATRRARRAGALGLERHVAAWWRVSSSRCWRLVQARRLRS
jgi:hypothetical protein